MLTQVVFKAHGLGLPVLVMPDSTKHLEAFMPGTVHMVGSEYQKILVEVSTLLDNEEVYEKMPKAVNSYSDGKANVRIIKFSN